MAPVPPCAEPTAQARPPGVAATASRKLLPAGVGPGTWVQAEPSQRTMRVFGLQAWPPTAQALSGEEAATPDRTSPMQPRPAGLGLGTSFHPAPSKRRIRVRVRWPAA